MLRAFVIFNQIGFPMFTYVNKNGINLHPSELLDRAEDYASKVSLSNTEFMDQDEKFIYVVALLPKKAKLVVIQDKNETAFEKQRLIEVATKIWQGDQAAIKDLITFNQV